MRTDELWRLGDRYVPNFKGVYPLNKLPGGLKPSVNFIVNTHTHNLPGEHWIAVSYKRGGIVYAFDPFGKYYPHLLRSYLHQLKPLLCVKYNADQFQEFYETSCGHYCIAWLITQGNHQCLHLFFHGFIILKFVYRLRISAGATS